MTKIEHWAYIESQVKQEVNRVLKANGFNHAAFRELETQAIEEMAEEMKIETGFGSVVRHFEVEQSGTYCDRLILTSQHLIEAPQSVGDGLDFLLPKRRTRNV